MGDDDGVGGREIWLAQDTDGDITDSRRDFCKSLRLRAHLEEGESDGEQNQKQKKFLARFFHVDAFIAAGFLKRIPSAECLLNMTHIQ